MGEKELESNLRMVLRAREPRPSASAKILAEVRRRERATLFTRWASLAAAVVLATALGVMSWVKRPAPADPAAIRAAAQLEEALRISSRKVAQLEKQLIVHVNSGIDLNRKQQN
jgi:ActR/RegA family two-component response regulator